MTREERLNELVIELTRQGIPVVSVALESVSPRVVSFQFREGATAQQQADAAALALSWDFRRTRKRPVADILADLDATPGAMNRLSRFVLAKFVQDNPRALRHLGVTIDGDTPEE